MGKYHPPIFLSLEAIDNFGEIIQISERKKGKAAMNHKQAFEMIIHAIGRITEGRIKSHVAITSFPDRTLKRYLYAIRLMFGGSKFKQKGHSIFFQNGGVIHVIDPSVQTEGLIDQNTSVLTFIGAEAKELNKGKAK